MLREEDKRNFSRYTKDSECELILPSGLCKGRIVDYSDGVGVLIDHASDLEEGAVVHVRDFDHDLEFKGRIAWVRRTGDTVRAGIKRADNFRGNVRFYRLADILIGINRSAKTGVLEVKTGSIRKKVFVKKGDIISATSTHGDERLGEHLLKRGIITLTELEDASHHVFKTGRKLEDIILEQCGLTTEEISREVEHQVENILLNLFLLEEGVFEFIEEISPADQKITVQLSTANIIYRGIKKINKYSFIKEMCPSVDDVLNPSHNPLRIFQSIDLEDRDKAILSCINGEYTVKEILALSPSSNYDALKTISVLMAIGLIDVKKEDEAPVQLSVDEMFSDPEVVSSDYLEKVDSLLATCEYGDHYDVLGVAKDASPDAIEKAYFHLSKQFHPDRHFSLHDPDVKEKLLKITSRTTAAYEILSDPDKKADFDTKISAADPKKSATREDGPESEEKSKTAVDGRAETSVNGSGKEDSPVKIPAAPITEETAQTEEIPDPVCAAKPGDLKHRHELGTMGEPRGIMNNPGGSIRALTSEYTSESDEFSEDQLDPGLNVVMVAQKKTWFRSRWFILPLIIIALTVVGVSVSFVHKKSGEQLKPAANKKHVDPPVKEEPVKLAALERHDGTDAQKRLSHLETKTFEKNTLPDFRNEALKKAWLDLFE